jgi:hypothetical protein
MWRKLFDVLFWLSASAYFGGMVMVGFIAPTVFATAKSSGMSMTGIVSPPLEMDRQVGGEVFGAILNRFATIEAFSLTFLAIAIAGWIVGYRNVRRSTWVIAALWVCLLSLTIYDTYAVRSKVWTIREDVRKTAAAHVANPTGDWPERAAFDVLHQRSEAVGHWKVYLLLATLVTAAWRGGAQKKQAAGIRRMRVMTPLQ